MGNAIFRGRYCAIVIALLLVTMLGIGCADTIAFFTIANSVVMQGDDTLLSIQYRLSEDSVVSIAIINNIGEIVALLVSEQLMIKNSLTTDPLHVTTWDYRDKNGDYVQKGLYLINFSTQFVTRTYTILVR